MLEVCLHYNKYNYKILVNKVFVDIQKQILILDENVAYQKVFIVHENLRQRAISPSENVLSLDRFWRVVLNFLERPKTVAL